MKQTILLVTLLIAAPAMAAVDLSCELTADTLTISYDASSEAELVRAFALDVVLSNGTIDSVASTNSDYWVYPGTIDIVDPNDANSIVAGSPVAPANDPGALGALGSNSVTIEMGSLYEPNNGPQDNNGVLITFNVTATAPCTATITSNVTRAKIVLEDASVVDSGTTCDFNQVPTCWDAAHCPAQPKGDANCNGSVNIQDVLKVRQSWLASCGDAKYNCCADATQNGSVNIQDILKVRQNWLASGLGGDGTLDCPPCP